MERLEYEDYEEFVCKIADIFDTLEDEFDDISIIAKYNEAKEIIKELLCLGYDIASIDIHREELEEYWDEYIISLNSEGIWCQKFKYENGYLNDNPSICFVMDNCNSAVFKHINSEEIYEVSIGDDEDNENYNSESKEHDYMVNGKHVDKKTFDKYVSKFAPDLVDKDNDTLDNDGYFIEVKCNIGTDEALSIIKDMECRMTCINDIFYEMDCFRRLFNW